MIGAVVAAYADAAAQCERFGIDGVEIPYRPMAI